MVEFISVGRGTEIPSFKVKCSGIHLTLNNASFYCHSPCRCPLFIGLFILGIFGEVWGSWHIIRALVWITRQALTSHKTILPFNFHPKTTGIPQEEGHTISPFILSLISDREWVVKRSRISWLESGDGKVGRTYREGVDVPSRVAGVLEKIFRWQRTKVSLLHGNLQVYTFGVQKGLCLSSDIPLYLYAWEVWGWKDKILSLSSTNVTTTQYNRQIFSLNFQDMKMFSITQPFWLSQSRHINVLSTHIQCYQRHLV